MTPSEKLMEYGYCKLGGRTPTGWHAEYTVRGLHEINGRAKGVQMRFLCAFFGLNLDWVESNTWRVRKSKNLTYHPATYTLEIVG